MNEYYEAMAAKFAELGVDVGRAETEQRAYAEAFDAVMAKAGQLEDLGVIDPILSEGRTPKGVPSYSGQGFTPSRMAEVTGGGYGRLLSDAFAQRPALRGGVGAAMARMRPLLKGMAIGGATGLAARRPQVSAPSQPGIVAARQHALSQTR